MTEADRLLHAWQRASARAWTRRNAADGEPHHRQLEAIGLAMCLQNRWAEVTGEPIYKIYFQRPT